MRAPQLRFFAVGLVAAATVALPGKPSCFWLRNFFGAWTVLNDRELIVYAPLYSRAYLVKLSMPVFGLNFDDGLGFQDVGDSHMICNDATDYLLVPHWQMGRVPIAAVRKLTVPEARRLLALNHLRLPPGSHPGKGNQAAGS